MFNHKRRILRVSWDTSDSYTQGEKTEASKAGHNFSIATVNTRRALQAKPTNFLKIESDVKILYLEKMSTDNIRKQMVLTSKNSEKIFVSIFIEV